MDVSSAPLFAGSDLACRRGERLVFAGLSFALAPGAALLLTGPNGSGKSSLLRLMTGLLRPERGELAWGGVATAEDPAAHRARLHFVGHHDMVKAALTVAETVRFWGGLRGGGTAAATAALERFRLGALADTPCRFLSAGQRRRLNLARLLASPAPLWLLDEPSTGLDRESTGDLERVIAEHRGGGGIVVVSTHVPLALDAPERLELGAYARARAAVTAASEIF
jgi:heme exporter protein A